MGLGLGLVIVLTALQMFFNIRTLLHTEAPSHSADFDFISISKIITNENMGQDNRFTTADIDLLKSNLEITAVGPLYSNRFGANISAGSVLPFSSELFMESLDNSFLDTIPADFSWQPGQNFVPLIFSSDFLEMYNVFAPAQGLPQVSAQTISSINVQLDCYGAKGRQRFTARITGLSDRVNSILVPENFLKWGNLFLAGDSTPLVSRVYIKTRDINNPALLSFLQVHDFYVNKDKVRFGRLRGVLQKVTAAIGVFGGIVLVLALLLFIFYLELIIARGRNSINLLLQIGYSPQKLSRGFTRYFLPSYLTIGIIALLVTVVAQFLFAQINFGGTSVSALIHPAVLITSIILILLILWVSALMVKREIMEMSKPE